MTRSRPRTGGFSPSSLVAALLAAGSVSAALAAPFGNANVVVYRVDNTATNKQAQSVYVDEFDADGTLVQTIALSTGATPLTSSGGGSEGLLTGNAQCLAVPGYAVAAGTADPKGATAAVAPRAVALVNANGTVSARITLGSTAYAQDSVRSAISNDCAGVWASGTAKTAANGGVWYATGSGSPAQLSAANTQGLLIANGQLLVSVAGGGTLNQLGAGLPTSGAQTATPVSGIAAFNYRGVALISHAGSDVLYVAANSDGTGKVHKYLRNGAAWTPLGTVVLAGVHGLSAVPTGGNTVMLIASDSSGNLFRWFDTSGPTGTLSRTPAAWLQPRIATHAFYGVARTPQATVPAAVPAAPSSATHDAVQGSSVTVRWTAAPSGPAAAFYVVESSTDSFATIDQVTATAGTQATLTGLANGAQKLRVRAVNSLGGSSAVDAGNLFIGVGAPPTTSLPNHTAFSGVVNDPVDALRTTGVPFTVADPAGDTAGLRITATSSNPAVVPASGLAASLHNGQGLLQVTPAGVGFADLTLTFTASNGATTQRVVHYAASAATAASASTRWFSGRSDGSTALVLPNGHWLTADDEAPAQDASGNALPGGNALFAYDPARSGLPTATTVPDAALDLANAAFCTTASGVTGLDAKCKVDGEVDFESSFALGSQLFFLGSHSNNKSGRARPDRARLLALDANAQPQGFYRWLREDLRTWDAANTHGLGAHYLGLVASSDGADNVVKAPETDTLSGFSIEGSTPSADGQAVYLGFRAPLVSAPGAGAVTADSAAGRTHALIIPVTNVPALASASGGVKGTARMGAPIRLDLGGRGIREMRKNAANEFLIIAGPPNSANGTAPRDFRLYSWDGRVSSAGLALNVRLLAADVAAFTPPQSACSAEGIGTLPATLAAGGAVDILSDCGDADFYASGDAAKDLPYAAWKRFRADTVHIAALPTVALAGDTRTVSITSHQAGQLRAVVLPTDLPAPSWEHVMAGQGASGQPADWASSATAVTAGAATPFSPSGLNAATRYTLYSVNVTAQGQASLVTALALSAPAIAAQTITFNALPDQRLGDPATRLTATGGASGQPVVLAATTAAVCRTSGDNGQTLTLLTTGTCTVRATQAAGNGLGAATPVERSFAITLPAAVGTTLPGGSALGATVSGNSWQFAANSRGALSAASLPGPLPAGFSFPYGGLGFALVGGAPGATASATVQLPAAAPSGATLWKFGPTASNPVAHWHAYTGSFATDRRSVSFSLQDGGLGDEDQLANGVILDPVAVGVPTTSSASTVQPVPTVSGWLAGLLGLGLLPVAARRLRRRT